MFAEHLRMAIKGSLSCSYPQCVCLWWGEIHSLHSIGRPHSLLTVLVCSYVHPAPAVRSGAASSSGFDGAISQRSNMQKWILSICLPNKSNRTIHRSFEKTFPVMCCLGQPFCAQAYHSRRSIIHSAYRMQCLSLFSACVFFMHPPPAQLLLGRFYLSRNTFHFINWFVLIWRCLWDFFHGNTKQVCLCFSLSLLFL